MAPQPPSHPVSDIVTTTWPRRAVKACASCRRDKIRCDGARPCGACVKKGYTVDQCIDGCESCRRARLRCEGGKPCLRCRDMHIECTEEHSLAVVRPDTTPPVLVLRSNRRKSERAKLACLSCRRDNKKCDDQRPCSRCVARSEECVHVGRGPKLVKLRCEGCRQDNRKCEDARPCRHCTEQGRECVSVQRKGRGHGTRVKAACANCRRDKVRCEGVRPCVTCVKKGYHCVDRACLACVQQGIDGECPHHLGPEPDNSEPEVNQRYLLHPHHHPPPPPMQASPPHVAHIAIEPMFAHPHMYPQYHLQDMQPSSGSPDQMRYHESKGPESSCTRAFPLSTYYPVIDPQIEMPQAQAHISSERYDPSSVTTHARTGIIE